ncbi:MAG: 16S rRNA (adenine(1518)-N(6)/adenine(1519)-N(6))-dimethyltransferase RsmA [Spirochaetales bacterium]
MSKDFFDSMDDSPAGIRDYLAENQIAARKRWGQNFLIDRPARELLISLLKVTPGMNLWEVGPGLGAMTRGLLDAGATVTAFEVDHGMVRHLRRRFAPELDDSAEGKGSLRIVEGDAAKKMPQLLEDGEKPRAILGNLPYNAAGAILWSVLNRYDPVERLVCTVQREVADRMIAEPGSRNFAAFSILCRLEHTARLVKTIPGGCFYPRPNVTSAAVLLDRRNSTPRPDRVRVLALANHAFAQPRKTLSNNLRSLCTDGRGETDGRLRQAGVDPSRRPSSLVISEICSIADAFADRL